MKLNKRHLSLIFGSLFTLSSFCQSSTAKQKATFMGSYFEVVAVGEDKELLAKAIDSAWIEIKRIEKLISSWDSTSQTAQINKNAGIQPVKVDGELFDLIKRSIKVSKLTQGAFDITYASMDKLWDFKNPSLVIPSEEEIIKATALIGYEKILLKDDNNSVYLLLKGMKIGFGAIGKGYAANRAKVIMHNMGIENGLVNAGGDLTAWGHKANGDNWKVGIADPKKKGDIFSFLTISNGAVVTSGNYERFVIIDKKRYAHIINPKTGYPTTGLKSVTILCPDTELADALATSVFVLGKEKGMQLINQLNEIECILVTDENEILTSENINLN